jgi:hypothetical protein
MTIEFEKHVGCGGFDNPAWGNDYTAIHGPTLDKVASSTHTPTSLLGVIEGLRPRPEGRYVLLNALGAYEYWGVNRNGDAFPEWSLKGEVPSTKIRQLHEKTAASRYPGMPTPIAGHYGFETFTKFAHVYMHHQNKDPLKAVGDVIASAYNEHMHRVELIVFVYEQRAPDVVKQIDAGDAIPWSMGSKLPYDLCSICLQASRSRQDYCIHLKSMLNTVLPDGRKVFSYNLFPRFFDISKVHSPADKSAWLLMKVASQLAPPIAPAYEMDLGKLSEIEKRPTVQSANPLGEAPIKPELLSFLRSCSRTDLSNSQDLPDPQMAKAKSRGVEEAFKALTALGIILKPAEVRKLAESDISQVPVELDLSEVNRTILTEIGSKDVVRQRSFFDPYFTKRAYLNSKLSAKPSLEKVAANDPIYQRYRDMLKALDMDKLAEVAVNNPTVRLILNPNSLVDLLANRNQDTDADFLLPFAVGASCC